MIVNLKREHLENIRLRKKDLLDLGERKEELFNLYLKHDARAIKNHNNEVVACYGYVKSATMKNVIAVWLLASDLINQHKKELIKDVRMHLLKLKNEGFKIVTATPEKDKDSLRWLEFLGFTTLEIIECDDGLIRVVSEVSQWD